MASGDVFQDFPLHWALILVPLTDPPIYAASFAHNITQIKCSNFVLAGGSPAGVQDPIKLPGQSSFKCIQQLKHTNTLKLSVMQRNTSCAAPCWSHVMPRV